MTNFVLLLYTFTNTVPLSFCRFVLSIGVANLSLTYLEYV